MGHYYIASWSDAWANTHRWEKGAYWDAEWHLILPYQFNPLVFVWAFSKWDIKWGFSSSPLKIDIHGDLNRQGPLEESDWSLLMEKLYIKHSLLLLFHKNTYPMVVWFLML